MGILGRLLIELAANTARLQSDMGKAVGIAEKAAGKMKMAFKFAGGGLIAAALVNTVKQSIEFGDQINKAAIKAGLGAKAMSELAYAAKLADVDIASLSTAMKKMQVALSEAGTGAKQPLQALAALGLKIEDIQRRKPDQQFELLAQRISELKDPADKARAATELFGKAGSDLLPMFEQGAAGIRKAREEAQKLGLSFSDENITALAKADDSIKRLSASWQGFGTVLTAKVAGPLSSILDMLSGIDSRDLRSKLTGDIASLEKSLQRSTIGYGGGVGGMSAQQRQKALDELANMRGRLSLLDAPKLTETGGRRGRAGAPLGYAAANAASEAKAAAEKASAAERKRRDKDQAERRDSFDKLNEDLLDSSIRRFDEELKASRDRTKEAYENKKEMEELVAKAQQEQANKLSDSARIFKDAFMNAWEDMVNTGKIKWDELLKYLVAEFTKRGIGKLLDSMFAPASSSSSAGDGGAWSSIRKVLGFAKGGRPQPGRPALIGEDGPELWVPDRAGIVVPNGRLGGGGGVTIYQTNHITLSGEGNDTRKMLDRALAENNRRLVDELDRGHRLVAA